MQSGYSLNYLVLNGQRNLYGDNRIVSMFDPKTELAEKMEVSIPLNEENEMIHFVKIGNAFTVPFFKK
jgi:hypothetical protein